MKTTALATILSLGLASAAMAGSHDHDAEPDSAEHPAVDASAETQVRPVTPTAEHATLADCQVWVDHLGEIIEAADDVPAEAEEAHADAARACDDGNYHEGITTAAEAVDMIEAAHDGDT